MKCPCIDCVCMPICRHKSYMHLFENCKLLHRWRLKNYSIRDHKYRCVIFESLHPTEWGVHLGEIYGNKYTL